MMDLPIQTITRHWGCDGMLSHIDLNGVPMPGMRIERVTILIDPTGRRELYAVQCRIAGVPVDLDYVTLEDVYDRP